MLQVGDLSRFDYSTLRWCMVRRRAGAGAVDRGLREAGHRSAPDLWTHGELRTGVSDRCRSCVEEDRLDRQSVLPHRHPRGQRSGKDCAAGEPGEVLVRGPHVMLGYWNRPEATAETIVDGWLRTGDVAVMDAEGYIYIQDRIKDMIISGGENVYPAEIENVLMGHEGIARGGGHRTTEREVGRVTVRDRRAQRRCADREGRDRVLSRPAGGLQAAARRCVRHRNSAQSERQDPEARSARSLSGSCSRLGGKPPWNWMN